MHRTRRLLRCVPATLILAALLLLAALQTGTVVAHPAPFWAVGVPTTLRAGAWWTLVSALIVPANPTAFAAAVIVGLPLMGIAERRLGSARLAWIFLLTGTAANALGVLLAWADSALGAWFVDPSRLPITLDPLSPIVGALLAATAIFGVLWRRRARLLVLGGLGMLVLNDGDAANGTRLIAALLGLLLGEILARGRSRRPAPTSAERRRLLGVLVAVSASGPVIALLSAAPIGPFAEIGRMLALPDASVLSRCRGVLSAACSQELSVGPGPLLLALAPAVLLVIAAVGIAQGHRLALLLAVGVQLATAALGFAALDEVSALERLSRAGAYGLWAAAAVLVPVLVAIVLLARRRLFPVIAPRRAALRWAIVVLFAFLLLGGAVMAVDGAGALAAARRFIPATMLAAPVAAPTELLLFHGVGPVFWAVGVLAVLRVRRASVREAAAARRVVREAGGGILGYRGLTAGARLLADPDGAGTVFRVADGVALAFTAPRDPRGFAAFGASRGWTAAVLGTAFDARVCVARELTLTSGSGAVSLDESSPLRMRTLWSRWEDLTLPQRLRLAAMTAEGSAPELGAFFGGDDSIRDPDAALLILFGRDERPMLVASWWPILSGRRTIGWGLEAVHRDPAAPAGVTQLFLAAARIRLRESGEDRLTVLAPPAADTPIGRAIDAGYRLREPASGLASVVRAAEDAGATARPVQLSCADSATLRAAAAALLGEADARALRNAAVLPASGESANGEPA